MIFVASASSRRFACDGRLRSGFPRLGTTVCTRPVNRPLKNDGLFHKTTAFAAKLRCTGDFWSGSGSSRRFACDGWLRSGFPRLGTNVCTRPVNRPLKSDGLFHKTTAFAPKAHCATLGRLVLRLLDCFLSPSLL